MTVKENSRAYLEEIEDYAKRLYEADKLEYSEEDEETLRSIWSKMMEFHLKKFYK